MPPIGKHLSRAPISVRFDHCSIQSSRGRQGISGKLRGNLKTPILPIQRELLQKIFAEISIFSNVKILRLLLSAICRRATFSYTSGIVRGAPIVVLSQSVLHTSGAHGIRRMRIIFRDTETKSASFFHLLCGFTRSRAVSFLQRCNKRGFFLQFAGSHAGPDVILSDIRKGVILTLQSRRTIRNDENSD